MLEYTPATRHCPCARLCIFSRRIRDKITKLGNPSIGFSSYIGVRFRTSFSFRTRFQTFPSSCPRSGLLAVTSSLTAPPTLWPIRIIPSGWTVRESQIGFLHHLRCFPSGFRLRYGLFYFVFSSPMYDSESCCNIVTSFASDSSCQGVWIFHSTVLISVISVEFCCNGVYVSNVGWLEKSSTLLSVGPKSPDGYSVPSNMPLTMYSPSYGQVVAAILSVCHSVNTV